MDIYKLQFTVLQLEIWRCLCVHTGEKINKRQLAALLHVSPTAVAKSLTLLEKEHLITVEKNKTMPAILVSLNRENKQAIHFKRAENLRLLYETELQTTLEEHYPGCTIILFGSYSRGEDTIKSDIDIAIIGAKQKDIALKTYEKILEKPIRINHYSTLNDLRKELKENLCNGIVLSGGIEL